MVTKREWLQQQGFTVGKRGRFSKEQLDALSNADVVFTDGGVITADSGAVVVAPKVKPEPGWVYYGEVARPDLPSAYIVGWTRNNKQHKQRWEICYECSYSIKFCICPRPTMAPWMIDRAAVVLDSVA